jgi:hypothetical protein
MAAPRALYWMRASAASLPGLTNPSDLFPRMISKRELIPETHFFSTTFVIADIFRIDENPPAYTLRGQQFKGGPRWSLGSIYELILKSIKESVERSL